MVENYNSAINEANISADQEVYLGYDISRDEFISGWDGLDPTGTAVDWTPGEAIIVFPEGEPVESSTGFLDPNNGYYARNLRNKDNIVNIHMDSE